MTSAKQVKTSILSNCIIYFHPAALSKVKKKILSQKVVFFGGELCEDLKIISDAGHLGIVLVDKDSINSEDKLKCVVSKLQELDEDQIEILDIKWLSETIKENKRQDYQDFRLKQHSTFDKSSNNISKISQEKPVKTFEQNFVCSKASVPKASTSLEDTVEINHEKLIEELSRLAKTYKDMNDKWRAFGYEKAIAAIKRNPNTVMNPSDAANIPGIGAKMAAKIAEILETGTLQKTKEVCSDKKAQTLNLFNRIWGVGPSTADTLYQQGLRSLKDLEDCSTLSKQQKVGLRLFSDLDQRMPYKEASQIVSFVENKIKNMLGEKISEVEIIGCGSYRRGKKSCGDVDVLIPHSHPQKIESFFKSLIQELFSEGFLTDHLSFQTDEEQKKYLGVCKLPGENRLHRRLDLIVVPKFQKAPALLYFTGSAHFNRSMRLLAKKKGMSLSHLSLSKGKEIVDTPTEESIFLALNLTYREPAERDH